MRWSSGWVMQKNSSAFGGTTMVATAGGVQPATVQVIFWFSSADVADATSFPSVIQLVICGSSNPAPAFTIDDKPYTTFSAVNSSCPYQSQGFSATSEAQTHEVELNVMQVDPNPFSFDYAAVVVPASASAILKDPQASSLPTPTSSQPPSTVVTPSTDPTSAATSNLSTLPSGGITGQSSAGGGPTSPTSSSSPSTRNVVG
ncbi:hypothetical protein EIP91_010413, partial [Steccherinum ochraceum]